MQPAFEEPVPELIPIHNDLVPEAPQQNDPVQEVIQQLPPHEDDLHAHEVVEEEEGAVLAMDDLTDQFEGEAPSPPAVIEPVQIVEFHNFANFEPVIPALEDEVQYEDLLGFINPKDEHHQDPFHQNLQIGCAQILQPNADPIFISLASQKRFQSNPEAVRLWVKFFSQNSSSYPIVSIPDAWISFFTFLLMQSTTFDWANSILKSPA
jgi:hypothetical protein